MWHLSWMGPQSSPKASKDRLCEDQTCGDGGTVTAMRRSYRTVSVVRRYQREVNSNFQSAVRRSMVAQAICRKAPPGQYSQPSIQTQQRMPLQLLRSNKQTTVPHGVVERSIYWKQRHDPRVDIPGTVASPHVITWIINYALVVTISRTPTDRTSTDL